MNPALFELDWNRAFQALAALVLLSMVVERSLSLIFENKLFLAYLEAHPKSVMREALALGLSAAACIYWDFDLPSILLSHDMVTTPGALLTGAVVAGGTKGSIKLFREVLDFKSGAVREREAAQLARVPKSPT